MNREYAIWSGRLIGETVIFKPTQTQRSMLLATKLKSCPAGLVRADSPSVLTVASISVFIAASDTTTQEVFADGDEAVLLRRFWLTIRARDRIFAAHVDEVLTLLRCRSWALGVMPLPDFDMRFLHTVQTVDTSKLWEIGYLNDFKFH